MNKMRGFADGEPPSSGKCLIGMESCFAVGLAITYLSDQSNVSCIFVVLVSCDFVVSHLVLEPDHEKTTKKDQATRKYTKRWSLKYVIAVGLGNAR